MTEKLYGYITNEPMELDRGEALPDNGLMYLLSSPIAQKSKNLLQSGTKNLFNYIIQDKNKAPSTNEILDAMFNIDNPNIETVPEKFNGTREMQNILNNLGANGKNNINYKTPIDNAIFNENNLYHYLFENEPKRLEDLNRVKRTFDKPNIIFNGIRDGKKYKYYAKTFNENGKIKGHLNITRNKSNGNFYQTNHRIRRNKLEKMINNGQTIYHDLPVPTAPMENSTPVNNIITNLFKYFKMK